MDDLKDRFLEFIRTERRLSELTVQAYGETLKIFEGYLMRESLTLDTADSDNIRDWIENLMDAGYAPAYVNKNLSALKTFYKFCLSYGYLSMDPAHAIIGPKKEKRLPSFLKESEIDRLLELLDLNENNMYNVRARSIIYMFYTTGMRAAELCSLDDSMVDFTSREIKITGKRNKQRIIPFGEELQKVMRIYLEVRDVQIRREDDSFFVTDKGRRMSYAQVRKIVKDNLQMVTTSKKTSPHVLRHTFATTMLNHNANLESIKKLLGHKSLDTTEIYTHTTFEKLKEVYNEAHPRAGLKKKVEVVELS